MTSLQKLQQLVHTLRGPQGCPWDRKQKVHHMTTPLLEECQEVIEAIHDQDPSLLREELGDLLFVVLLTCDTAHKDYGIHLDDICADVHQKMVRRHPHVFSDQEEDNLTWEERKQKEKKRESILDGIPKTLPALAYAQKQAKRVAKVGFDWPTADAVFGKVQEEIGELQEAIKTKDQEHIEHELGDILMACANLGRKLNISSEFALQKATKRFHHRFQWMEQYHNGDLSSLSAQELESLWRRAKKHRK